MVFLGGNLWSSDVECVQSVTTLFFMLSSSIVLITNGIRTELCLNLSAECGSVVGCENGKNAVDEDSHTLATPLLSSTRSYANCQCSKSSRIQLKIAEK